MDAYEFYIKIRNMWAENYDRNSGMITKWPGTMPIVVNGKRVVDVVYKDGQIELKVEE